MRFILAIACFISLGSFLSEGASRPNILWITSEDNGPHLGAYGDSFATTPNLDALAMRGTLYLNAWANAPVCAPARTTIISGVYPTATGAEHMRSMVALPPGMLMFPARLREAGYYCTNNSKEDYNLQKTGEVWDESSSRAHWKNRKPGQPFFAVFNITTTHESQIRRRPHDLKHDPKKVPVPAYHPDTPEVREDWAQYYDKMTEMDAQAGKLLDEIQRAGLAEETIIFYYGDHGPGMPRSKRWPYNSGLRVPLIVFVPEKFSSLRSDEYGAGAQVERLVGFVDFAPTVLSLAGIKPPSYMHGQPFLGKYNTGASEYLHGFRGRMDERYDLVRSVREDRFIYIRNYMPHRIYGQYLDYMFQTPTTRVWKELYDAGKLEAPMTYFWEPKPPEELYDLQDDPDEVNNLAGSKEHEAVLKRLRKAHEQFVFETRDLGFLPEAEIHERAGARAPYELGNDSDSYPLKEIYSMADLASSPSAESRELIAGLAAEDSAVRYWAVTGLLIRGKDAVLENRAALKKALADSSPSVRVVAAEALGQFGNDEELKLALDELVSLASLDQHTLYVAIAALNAVDALGNKAEPIAAELRKLPSQHKSVAGRVNGYVPRLLEHINGRFEN